MTKRLLNTEAAAELLHKTPSALRLDVFRRKVPFYRVGRSLRFDVEELREFVDAQRVVSVEEALKRCGGSVQ